MVAISSKTFRAWTIKLANVGCAIKVVSTTEQMIIHVDTFIFMITPELGGGLFRAPRAVNQLFAC